MEFILTQEALHYPVRFGLIMKPTKKDTNDDNHDEAEDFVPQYLRDPLANKQMILGVNYADRLGAFEIQVHNSLL
jgi:hypothetical protein